MKRLLLLILCVYCQQVFAHKTSDSYLNIINSEDKSGIRWSISLRDIEYAVGLDMDADNRITWSEVMQRQVAIESYVLSRLSLHRIRDQFKHPCDISNESLLVEDKSDGAYLVFDIVSPCLSDSFSAEDLFISYQLMFDIDKNHRGLILIQTGNKAVALVASPDDYTFNIRSKKIPVISIFMDYVIEGVWHILIGMDHILFLLALLLPSVMVYKQQQWQHRENIRSCFKSILKIVTAFTIAHSITLTLSVLQIVQLPSQLIEVLIAITVLLTCLHVLKPIFQHALWKLAFVFGLIHGFGFANVLLDLGLEQAALALSLLGFNVGVEIGQLFIVWLFILFAAVVHKYWWYRVVIFQGGISATAILSGFWIYERLFNVEILGF